MGYISLLIAITVIGAMAYLGFSAYTPTIPTSQDPIQSIAINLPMQKTYVTIGKIIIQVEVAGTPVQHAQGLSGRTSLSKDQGMLFSFNQPRKPGFWMKDMRFPIDIIWIDADGNVAGIMENLKPESYPEQFYPPEEILHVLEVNAGYAKAHGIKIGDTMHIAALPN